MAPGIVPTLLQEIVYHIFNGCLFVAILAPILTYGLKPKRRKAAIIQCVIEVILLALLIVNIVLALDNGVTVDYILNEINPYKGMIEVWALHFIIVGGAWFRFIRKLSKDQQESQEKKLTQPPQPLQE